MSTYTAEVRDAAGAVLGSRAIEVTAPATSPRIVGNGTASPAIEWDAVAGATSYKTYWPGDTPSPYRSHLSTTRSWPISPTYPGETRTIGWTYVDAAGDHWISPELPVTFAGTPPPPPPPGDRLPMGVVANSNVQDVLNASVATFHAESVRIEMNTWTPSAWVSQRNAVAAAGIPHALLHWSDTWGATNARASAVAAALAAAGYTRENTTLGAGNEDSYSYKGTQGRGGDYGRIYKACHDGIAGRFDLVSQADDPTGAGWINAMYAGVAGLVVDVWDTHPYGPKSRSQPMIERVISQTASHGSSAPVWITEYGFSCNNDGGAMSDGNYDWPPQNWQQAADALNLMVPWFKTYDRILRFFYFQGLNQTAPDHSREHNFGLCLCAPGMQPKTPLVNAFVTLAGMRLLRFNRIRRALRMRTVART